MDPQTMDGQPSADAGCWIPGELLYEGDRINRAKALPPLRMAGGLAVGLLHRCAAAIRAPPGADHAQDPLAVRQVANSEDHPVRGSPAAELTMIT
jgi:hypothetical protein